MAFTTDHMNTKHLWGLASGLLELQRSGRFCDIQLLCADGIINAHTAVLTSACSTFQATIQHTHMHLPMMEYSSDTVQRMVKYLYTGQIDRPALETVVQFESLMRTLGLPVTQPVTQPVNPPTTKESMTFSIRNTSNASASAPSGDENFTSNAKQEIDLELLSLSLNSVQSAVGQKPTVSSTGDLVPHPAGAVQFPPRGSDSEDDANFEETDVKYVPELMESPSKKRKAGKAPAENGQAEVKKRKRNRKKKAKLAAQKKASEESGEPGEKTENESGTKEGEEGNDLDDIVLPPRRKKKSSPNKPKLCQLCGKSAGKDYRQFIQHQNVVHGVPFKEEDITKGLVVKCDHDGCSFMSANKVVLIGHIYKMHDPLYLEKISSEYKCNVCQKIFAGKHYLKAHTKNMHSEIERKKLPCHICGHCFHRDDHLKNHIRMVHQNEGKICPHCSYHGKGGLIQMRFHMVTKHNDKSMGEAIIYPCKYCEYKTYSKQHNKFHTKRHEIAMGIRVNDVLCDICGKAFVTKGEMTNHRNTHDGARSNKFKCDFCSYTSARKSHVCRHTLQVHNNSNVTNKNQEKRIKRSRPKYNIIKESPVNLNLPREIPRTQYPIMPPVPNVPIAEDFARQSMAPPPPPPPSSHNHPAPLPLPPPTHPNFATNTLNNRVQLPLMYASVQDQVADVYRGVQY